MDVGALSMAMSQNSIANAVDLSVMKMAMNSENETSTTIDKMMSNMAVDPNLGTLLDRRA
ncbi:YjfB family protein [Inconstantimicrobium mannanitabidum]|uniref:Uncharacterized protein n=1 Tax=Inconstantimicrobium mannanitabidum TaxID=1604901 RepID=A0ACB5R8W8_9CLOT|nr:YjfB family protein [Clostridium sp. TW13]GKX65481.1 hypothetical protein rsdtw13_07390 [Clostridium sp. TW13]